MTYVGIFWKIRSTTLIWYFYVIKLSRRGGACRSCPRQNAWHCQQLPSPCLLAISSVHDSAHSAEMKLAKMLEKVCYLLQFQCVHVFFTVTIICHHEIQTNCILVPGGKFRRVNRYVISYITLPVGRAFRKVTPYCI